MNTQIQLLKQQAGIDYNPDQAGLDLFAELIIRECANIADIAEPYKSTENILKHFGVKE